MIPPGCSGTISKDSVKTIGLLDGDEVPLAREIPFLSTYSIVLCGILITTDVAKTCLSYSMKHHNNDVYPVNPTIIVTVSEGFKALVVIAIHLYWEKDHPFKDVDPKIAVPCALYAITNNLFFAGLHYVSPAIWIVLIQMRVVFLLSIYRFYLKQKVTPAQYIGAVFLMFGVGLTQIDQNADFRTIIGPALGLAALTSLLSAFAGVSIEVVLKRGGSRSLMRNQTHLYCGSAFSSVIPIMVSLLLLKHEAFDVQRESVLLVLLVVLTVILTVINGICVSLVIKNLDNIVRFQVSTVTYILTAGANSFLFPEKFHLSIWYVISIGVIIFSVFLIEQKKFSFCQENPRRLV